jgi:hypothetical protein
MEGNGPEYPCQDAAGGDFVTLPKTRSPLSPKTTITSKARSDISFWFLMPATFPI